MMVMGTRAHDMGWCMFQPRARCAMSTKGATAGETRPVRRRCSAQGGEAWGLAGATCVDNRGGGVFLFALRAPGLAIACTSSAACDTRRGLPADAASAPRSVTRMPSAMCSPAHWARPRHPTWTLSPTPGAGRKGQVWCLVPPCCRAAKGQTGEASGLVPRALC